MDSFLLGGGGPTWKSPHDEEPIPGFQPFQPIRASQAFQISQPFQRDDGPTTPTKSNGRESGPRAAEAGAEMDASAVASPVTEGKSNNTNNYSIAQSDMTHDSMVTVPLSGPPSLAIDTNIPVPLGPSWLGRSTETIGSGQQDAVTDLSATSTGRNSAAVAVDVDDETTPQNDTPRPQEAGRSLETELQESGDDDDDDERQRTVDTPTPSTPTREPSVNWDELQKTENEQPKDEQMGNVCEPLPGSSVT